MIYKHVKISDIGEVITGNTPAKKKSEYYDSKDIMLIKPNDFNSNRILNISRSKEYISIKGSEAGRKIQKGAVLVTCIGIIGKVAITNKEACFNQQINAIVVKDDIINNKFLAYTIEHRRKRLEAIANAPVVPIINKTEFSKFKIPLPPLPIQKKIVHVLDKAQQLINLREKQISHLDELVQSVFYDMFGDPVTNPKGWETCLIKDLISEITSGWSIGGEERLKTEGEIGVLKISAVTTGIFNSQAYKVVNANDLSISGKKLLHPQKGDILFSRANTRELVAATCIVDKDYNDLFLPDKLWKINVKENQLNNYWFKELLSHKKYRLTLTKKASGTSGSMLNISKKKFENTYMPIPPITLQSEFAKRVEKIEYLKSLMQESLEEMKNNYNSLMQRAFKGELFTE